MPRPPRRINVTLSADVHAAVMEWAKVTGFAPPQLVAMIMSNSLPVVHAMTNAMRVAKSDPQKAIAIMSELVDGASVGVAQMQLDMRSKSVTKKIRRSTKQLA
jgi:hypothetical protein